MIENEFSVKEFIVREMGYPGVIKQEIVGELVRCADCKYYKESVALSPQKFCFRMKDRYGEAAIGYNFAEDDFCSYGERSEE